MDKPAREFDWIVTNSLVDEINNHLEGYKAVYCTYNTATPGNHNFLIEVLRTTAGSDLYVCNIAVYDGTVMCTNCATPTHMYEIVDPASIDKVLTYIRATGDTNRSQ